jgi:choline monooxygenase
LMGRPGATPDTGQLVMFSMTRFPPGTPRTKPMDLHMTAEQATLGMVLDQDLKVLDQIQRGLHSPGFTHLVISNEERRLINTHRNLERYIDLPESERMTSG